jgi:hypothetical protein
VARNHGRRNSAADARMRAPLRAAGKLDASRVTP